MQILIVSATEQEVIPLIDHLKENRHLFPSKHISICFTGVGIMNSTYNLTEQFNHLRYNLAIQVGIAGCFDKSIELGRTFAVSEEVIGDLGVMESEYRDVFDIGLADKDFYPFKDKRLINHHETLLQTLNIDTATAVTVNKISTGNDIEMIRSKYDCMLESMEGAAFHYVCLRKEIPFIQLRSVSNYIGERDKSNWRMREAIENVNNAAIELLYKL